MIQSVLVYISVRTYAHTRIHSLLFSFHVFIEYVCVDCNTYIWVGWRDALAYLHVCTCLRSWACLRVSVKHTAIHTSVTHTHTSEESCAHYQNKIDRKQQHETLAHNFFDDESGSIISRWLVENIVIIKWLVSDKPVWVWVISKCYRYKNECLSPSDPRVLLKWVGVGVGVGVIIVGVLIFQKASASAA